MDIQASERKYLFGPGKIHKSNHEAKNVFHFLLLNVSRVAAKIFVNVSEIKNC